MTIGEKCPYFSVVSDGRGPEVWGAGSGCPPPTHSLRARSPECGIHICSLHPTSRPGSVVGCTLRLGGCKEIGVVHGHG
jgi:hypothetical protein